MNVISENRCKELIQYVQTLLDISLHNIENEYGKLTLEVGSNIYESTIEIRLNEDELTMSCSTNKQKQCTDVYFFFDKTENEDAFLNYLIDFLEYSFRKRVWYLAECIISSKKIKDIFAFHFYKLSEINHIRTKKSFSFFKKKVNFLLLF